MDDELVIARPKTPAQLLQERFKPVEPPPVPLDAGSEAAAALDEVSPLPRPGDAYQALSRASNKPVLTLVLVFANATREGFAYADMRRFSYRPADQPGGGMVIKIRVIEAEAVELVIAGRNLDELFDQLQRHRVGWVRELPPGRDFLDGRETVITSMVIRPLKIEG